jgi:hypothetical protein
MRIIKLGTAAAAAAMTVLVGGAHASALTNTAPTWPKQICSVDKGMVHFRTPEAAMKYLAAAWNCHDVSALRHVTNPDARASLLYMNAEAKNLRFVRCTDYGRPGRHAYGCTFTHDYPASVAHDNPSPDGRGQAYLDVRPARAPGFYATVVGCG